MVLPITLSNAFFLFPNGGPWKVGASFYVLARDAGANTRHTMFKADTDDPSSGWTEQDTGGRPNVGSLIDSSHGIVDSSLIHVADQQFQNNADYHIFTPSSNTWTTINQQIHIDGTTTGEEFCSESVRSDGDVIHVSQGLHDANMGTDYDRVDLARRETGSWTSGIDISTRGKTAVHEQFAFVIRGDAANDRMHVFYHNTTDDELIYATYLSNNTFGHQDSVVDANTGATIDSDSVRAVSFDDGGTIKVRAFYLDVTSLDISVVGFNDADDPGTSISIATDITENAPSSFAVVMDGAVQHLLYVNSTTIYHDETGDGNDTWGTDESELASLTSPVVFSCNVYDNSGKVLAYLYLDGSNYRYNERSLAAAAGIVPFLPPPLRTPNLRI